MSRSLGSNLKSEWVTHDVPDLRIIDQDLSDQVKARQEALQVSQSRESPEVPAHRADVARGGTTVNRVRIGCMKVPLKQQMNNAAGRPVTTVLEGIQHA